MNTESKQPIAVRSDIFGQQSMNTAESSACSCPLDFKTLVKSKIKQQTLVQLCSELKIVDALIKPAWLCDLLCPSDIDIKELLENLTRTRFLCEKLHTLIISGDILVVHLKTFSNQINAIIESLDCLLNGKSAPVFVVLKNSEISKTLNVRLKEKIKKSLLIVADRINNFYKTSDNKELNFDMGDMTPTIFGIALGYPVIYIQENVNTIPDTLNLHVIEAKMKLVDFPCSYCQIHRQIISNVVYSFSLPKEVANICLVHVNSWKKRIYEQCKLSKVAVINTTEKELENAHVIL